jgi:hypothetical protein
LLTIILNYICAVFLTQTIGQNAELWGDEAELIRQWFGSIGHSMRTLFIIITLAEWDQIALVVSKHVNGLVVFILAIGFITLTAFTMVSLITGIISEELVGAQREDEVHKLEQIEKGRVELVANVKSLLQTFDLDNSGTLSESEVHAALTNPEIKILEKLQALDISMEQDDLLSLISRLKESNGTEELKIEDIAEALKHLSGNATSSSIWDLRMLVLQLQKEGAERKDLVDAVARQQGLDVEHMTNGHSKTHGHLEETMVVMNAMVAKSQEANERLEGKVDALIVKSERLEALYNGSDKIEKLDSRVQKVEEVMQLLCNVLLRDGISVGKSGQKVAPEGNKVPEDACQAFEAYVQNRSTDVVAAMDN